MVSRVQREMALRRKLQVLRVLANSKSVTKNSIIIDALTYINHLKLRVESLSKACGNQMKQLHVPTDVKVEKIEKGYQVRVTCEKGRDVLLSLLEVFEHKGLNVLHANISCNPSFSMEAIIEGPVQTIGIENVTQAIKDALGSKMMG